MNHYIKDDQNEIKYKRMDAYGLILYFSNLKNVASKNF